MARLKKQVGLTLEPAFLARVDEARGDVSRNRFIERALEEMLGVGPDQATGAVPLGQGDGPHRASAVSPRASSEPRWTCKGCGASNPADAAYCVSCDQRKVPVGVEMAQRRVSGHVRPPIPKEGS